MKKIFLLIIGFALAFGMLGCNNTLGTGITVVNKEYIAAPTNLSVSGTNLTWDNVDSATGYAVYANDEKVADVKTNSYDFSSIVADRLIFKVMAKAPSTMLNSSFSATVAYIQNPAAELQTAKAAITTAGLSFPDTFAEELINKGMLGSEVGNLAQAFSAFQTALQNVSTPSEGYAAVNTFLSGVDNVEAIVSAAVLTYLPQALQPQIDLLQDKVDQYQLFIDQHPSYASIYQSSLDQYQMQLDMYTEILDQLNNDPQSIVLSLTSTVEYLISVEQMISQSLIDTITSVSETTDVKDLNASELNVIKDETVNILRETMPSQEDMTLIFQLYDILMNAMGQADVLNANIDNYTGKMAIQTLYRIEAFINFLDTFDETYFSDVIGYLNNDTHDMAIADISIETITYFKTFKDANQSLLDSIDNTFTDQEKEYIYNNYLDIATTTDSSLSMLSTVSFQDLLTLRSIGGDVFDAVLNKFVERDGALLKQLIILADYQGKYNRALDQAYATYADADKARLLTTINVAEEVANILKSAADQLSQANYELLANVLYDYVIGIVQMQYSMMSSMMTTTTFDPAPFKTAFDAIMAGSGSQQFNLMKGFVDYMVSSDAFANLRDATNFYYDNIDQNYAGYGFVVVAAQIYNGFMTSANRSAVDTVVTQVIDALNTEALREYTNMSSAHFITLKSNITNTLDFLDVQCAIIKNINYQDLSISQISAIDTFITSYHDYLSIIAGN